MTPECWFAGDAVVGHAHQVATLGAGVVWAMQVALIVCGFVAGALFVAAINAGRARRAQRTVVARALRGDFIWPSRGPG